MPARKGATKHAAAASGGSSKSSTRKVKAVMSNSGSSSSLLSGAVSASSDPASSSNASLRSARSKATGGSSSRSKLASDTVDETDAEDQEEEQDEDDADEKGSDAEEGQTDVVLDVTKVSKKTKKTRKGVVKARRPNNNDSTVDHNVPLFSPPALGGGGPLSARTFNSNATITQKTKRKPAGNKKGLNKRVAAEDSGDELDLLGADGDEGDGAVPEAEIQAFLANFDLEVEKQQRRAQAALELSIQQARTAQAISLSRIPRAIREMDLWEFLEKYDGDVDVFMSRIGTEEQGTNRHMSDSVIPDSATEDGAMDKGQPDASTSRAQGKKKANNRDVETEEWETLKEQVVNAGLKRGNDEGGARSPNKTKQARTGPAAGTSAASSSARGKAVTRKRTGNVRSPPTIATAARLRTGPSSNSGIGSSSLAFPSSPSTANRNGSQPPSSSFFNPRLDAGNVDALSTPSGSRRLIDAGASFSTIMGGGSSSILGSSSFARPTSSSKNRAATQLAAGLTTPGGRSRIARVGERVQWMSLNGSPLVGVIDSDGRLKQISVGSGGGATGGSSRNLSDQETLEAAFMSTSLSEQVPRSSFVVSSDADADRTGTGADEGGADDSLPDEAAYTAQIIAAETSRRVREYSQQQLNRAQNLQHQRLQSSGATARPPVTKTKAAPAKAKNRHSVILGQSGRELDLATASPKDLDGLSPRTRDKAREAILRYHQEQQSRWA